MGPEWSLEKHYMRLRKRLQSPRGFQHRWKKEKTNLPRQSKEERGRGIGDRASHRKKKLPRFSLMADGEKPLRKIAASFKDLAAAVNSQNPEVQVEVAPFSAACSHVSVLFGCLGIAFKFAEMDYVAKVPNPNPNSSSPPFSFDLKFQILLGLGCFCSIKGVLKKR